MTTNTYISAANTIERRHSGIGIFMAFMATFFCAWLCVSVAEAPARVSLTSVSTLHVVEMSQTGKTFRASANGGVNVSALDSGTPGNAAGGAMALKSGTTGGSLENVDLFGAPEQCNMLTHTCGASH